METNKIISENTENDIIRFEDVSYSYDENGVKMPVLNGLNLSVKRGSFVALLGKNGSGKSTVAKLINMLIDPTSGKIFIDGTEITSSELSVDEFYELRRRIGFVFQNPDNQIVTSVVEEDIAFGPENIGTDPKEIRQRVDSVMETMGLTSLARKNPANLSGGQKQRVAIAGVLAMQPECMIFDESTAMLDPSGRHEVMDIIGKLNKEHGITILLITHNMDEAALADRVIVLQKEEGILLDGSPREVFSKTEILKTTGLDVPQTTQLNECLRKRGLNIPEGITDEHETAEYIMKAIKENGKKNICQKI